MEILGWNSFFENHFLPFKQKGLIAARIAAQHGRLYTLHGPDIPTIGRLSGAFIHATEQSADYPTVGDWVAVRVPANGSSVEIEARLERTSKLSRRAAGTNTMEQLLAANVDLAFIATSPVSDFNVQRLDRYLSVVRSGGVCPVLVFTKCELRDDSLGITSKLPARFSEIQTVETSAYTGLGISSLRALVGGNKTAVCLGSSGVGKSTLINSIIGTDAIATQPVRLTDGKGRHTTTERRLHLVPGGGIVIDTPGMRELGLWDAGAGIEETFDRIVVLAGQCRFSDCQHETEPECAVLAAIGDDTLTINDLTQYKKLLREEAHEKRRADKKTRAGRERKKDQRVKRSGRIMDDHAFE